MRRAALSVMMALAAQAHADAGTSLENPQLPGLTAQGTLTARLETARRALGTKDTVRTRHVFPDGQPKYTNRLILESSPYLQQHAHNPVNWFPWGEEAFARARAEGKPLFLSVGYSTCHWCHVMEGESFEDEGIAALLNARFIPVKVDREEHPDVDATYMSAVQTLSGRGGWPMTVVATGDGAPFFAATYLPPRDTPEDGRGLESLLTRLSDLYAKDPSRLTMTAARVTASLTQNAVPPPPGPLPTATAIDTAVAQLAARYDAVNGGFGGAPRFPSPSSIEMLLRQFHRTGDVKALQMATNTLDAMARGGLHDQLGGGFHRYSTDAQWRVPHFEKMLYDNAQLAALYLDASQATGRADFAAVARDTLRFLERDLSATDGGFFAASDADSPVPGRKEQREGYFYTWTPDELVAALGQPRASHLATVLGVSATGNLDGRSVLFRAVAVADAAKSMNLEAGTLQREVDESRDVLLAVRARRPAPARDEKVVAAWNGLAISAFARGALVLGEPRLADRAAQAARFVLGTMTHEGRLSRTWCDGRGTGKGTLEDHAFVIQGLLDLHEATQDLYWLDEALVLQASIDAHFANGKAAYFRSPDDAGRLLYREVPETDGVEPSGNSIEALNLLRLSELTGSAAARARALQVLEALSRAAAGGVGAHKLLGALDFELGAPVEVVVVEAAPGSASALLGVLREVYLSNHVLVRALQGDELKQRAARLPLLQGRTAKKGGATAYVCRRKTCELPTSDPATFRAQLEKR